MKCTGCEWIGDCVRNISAANEVVGDSACAAAYEVRTLRARVAELEGIERAASAHLERRKKNAEALGFECSASHKLRVKELESVLAGLGPNGKKVQP